MRYKAVKLNPSQQRFAALPTVCIVREHGKDDWLFENAQHDEVFPDDVLVTWYEPADFDLLALGAAAAAARDVIMNIGDDYTVGSFELFYGLEPENAQQAHDLLYNRCIVRLTDTCTVWHLFCLGIVVLSIRADNAGNKEALCGVGLYREG